MASKAVTDDQIRQFAVDANDRFEFWTAFLNAIRVSSAVEVGVYRGRFARHVMKTCRSVRRYYMIDPWRHLDEWDKPMNVDDTSFEENYQLAMRNTARFSKKRVVLRGKTTEVIDDIKDGSLDFAYIDGDHTLRGITIDLARVYPKVRPGGWIGGDDFLRRIFHHKGFEPTLVFPYAVYFAEAIGARIYSLPHRQFLMQKADKGGEHEFVDLAGGYGDLTLLAKLRRAQRANDEDEQPAEVPFAGESA